MRSDGDLRCGQRGRETGERARIDVGRLAPTAAITLATAAPSLRTTISGVVGAADAAATPGNTKEEKIDERPTSGRDHRDKTHTTKTRSP